MIILHVYLKVDPAKRELFFDTVNKVIAGTVKEDGCITYHLFEDTVEANTFILVEKWRDAEALEKHAQTPHYITFKDETQERNLFLAPPQLERYEVTA